jgi:hypothetical protein
VASFALALVMIFAAVYYINKGEFSALPNNFLLGQDGANFLSKHVNFFGIIVSGETFVSPFFVHQLKALDTEY